MEYKLTEYWKEYCNDLRKIKKGLKNVKTADYRDMYLDLLEDQLQCLNNGNYNYEEVIIEILKKRQEAREDYYKHVNELCKLINELLKLVKKNH